MFLALVISTLAAAPCTEISQIRAPRGGRVFVVRMCGTEPGPGIQIDDSGKYQHSDKFVEYGVIDTAGEGGVRDLWFLDIGLRDDGEAGLEVPSHEPACADAEAAIVHAFSQRTPRAFARTRRVARCILALTPRLLGWSDDGRFMALRHPAPPQADVIADPGLVWKEPPPLRDEVIDSATATLVLLADPFLGFSAGRVRGGRAWPRSCLPGSLDALNELSPCGTTRARLIAVVDLEQRALVELELPPVSPTSAQRDPFEAP